MEAALATLSSPVVLFFMLGMGAAFARSDLTIPEAVAKGLSIYLMIAIGLKGGVEVSKSGFTPELALAAAAGVALSFLIPFFAYWLLTRIGRLSPVNAAAVSAHYGSVSVVTFVTAAEMLTRGGLTPAGYMVAVLALMETPAIISGLLLARRGGVRPDNGGGAHLLHEVLLNASVVLLIGSFAIGLAAGPDGFVPISPLFNDLFRGLLCIFLLDMGLVAGRRLIETRALTARAASLGIALPVINGALGVVIGTAIGLDAGSAAALGILAASASYIAVPAAMRLALPEADPGLYLSMSLGVTFPFNIIVGIPLFAMLAQALG
ncbi:MAG TPA: sodium-dependent bicarbonate transport family permease [Sphingomicrobium sp.]|nr:sodium-dependent bicarbonate transport family permease [Sphingomicrobium sp.]